jgi:hypothetical protein
MLHRYGSIYPSTGANSDEALPRKCMIVGIIGSFEVSSFELAQSAASIHFIPLTWILLHGQQRKKTRLSLEFSMPDFALPYYSVKSFDHRTKLKCTSRTLW